MRETQAKFSVGQVVHHKIFDYRGIIVDVDPLFQQAGGMRIVGKAMPTQSNPWYHVLVDGTDYRTYVAEQNLENDPLGLPISHPDLEKYFRVNKQGDYELKRPFN